MFVTKPQASACVRKVRDVRIHSRSKQLKSAAPPSAASEEASLTPSRSIVVLTGAGISAESGIRTFRDSNGLWEDHRIDDVATPEGFQRDPLLVQSFYNARRRQLLSPEVAPNAAHHALVKLQKEFSGSFTLVTQNVDDLHERAGNSDVIHMHGELLKMRCVRSNRIYEIKSDIDDKLTCACCNQTKTLRPHIVWFGEMPLFMDEIIAKLASCDLFISIGTSGQVYPAAMFVEYARHAHRIEINPENTERSHKFDRHIALPASKGVAKIVEEILQTTS